MRRIVKFIRFVAGAGVILSVLSGLWISSRLDNLGDKVECWLTPKAGQLFELTELLKWQSEDVFTMLEGWTWTAICNSAVTSTRGRISDLEVNHVGDKYYEVAGITLLKGRFIWKEDIESKRHVMVIDSKLAYELFGHTECIGLEAEYGGEKFEIIGICSTDSIIVKKAAFRAFVPGSIKVTPECIGVIGKVGNGRGRISGAALKSSLLASVPGYSIDAFNIQEQKLMLRQKLFINLRLIFLIIIIIVFRVVFNRLKQRLVEWRYMLESSYLPEFIFHHWKELLETAAVAAGSIALALLLWKLSAFELVIPSGLIPKDLTDLNQFVKNISEYFLEMNRGVGYIPASMLYVHFCSRIVDICGTIFWLDLLVWFALSHLWNGNTGFSKEIINKNTIQQFIKI